LPSLTSLKVPATWAVEHIAEFNNTTVISKDLVLMSWFISLKLKIEENRQKTIGIRLPEAFIQPTPASR
jgi:hypothetical protein